jgi:hypothetical protein
VSGRPLSGIVNQMEIEPSSGRRIIRWINMGITKEVFLTKSADEIQQLLYAKQADMGVDLTEFLAQPDSRILVLAAGFGMKVKMNALICVVNEKRSSNGWFANYATLENIGQRILKSLAL